MFSRQPLMLKKNDCNITTKEEAIQLVKSNYLNYQELPEKFRQDAEVIEAAMRNPLTFMYLSHNLQAKYAHQAFKSNGALITHAADELKNDRELVKLALKTSGLSLKITPKFQDDDEVVKIALSHNIKSIQYTSSRIRGDRGLFMQHPEIYCWASVKLRNNLKLTLLAIQKDHDNVKFMGDKLKDSESVADYVVKYAPEKFRFMSERIRSIRKYAEASMTYTHNFQYFSDLLCDDDKLAFETVEDKPLMFEYVSPRLQDNDKLADLAMKKEPRAFSWASKRIRYNDELAKQIIAQEPRMFKFASPQLRDDFDFVKTLIVEWNYGFKFASEHLRKNMELIKIIIDESTYAGEFIIYDEKNHDEFVELAKTYPLVNVFLCSEMSGAEFNRRYPDEKAIIIDEYNNPDYHNNPDCAEFKEFGFFVKRHPKEEHEVYITLESVDGNCGESITIDDDATIKFINWVTVIVDKYKKV